MKGLIFTYVLTYGGALASFINPYYGFLAYVCLGIMPPHAMWPWSVPASNYSRTIAVALILGWVLHGMGSCSFGRARPILAALGIFWGVNLLSTIIAPDSALAWEACEKLTKILLPLFIGCTLMDSVAKVKQLIWVIALSQGYVALEMNSSYFSGYNRLYWQGFASLDNNTAAVAMVMCAGIAFFLALHETSRLRQGVAAVIFVLATHAVMFSFSRGALLSLIVCGAAAFVVMPKRPLFVGGFIVAALIGVRLAGPEVMARFSTTFASEETRDKSASNRLALWKGCMVEMAEHPLIGIGPEHWKLVSHKHGVGPATAAHSLWMQTGAESGVTGLASLLAFYLLCALHAWRLGRTGAVGVDPELAAMARMVLCGLCGFVVAAQFVSVGTVEIPYYVAAAGIGVIKLASLAPVAAHESVHDFAPENWQAQAYA